MKTKRAGVIACLPTLCYENCECKYNIQKIPKYSISQFYNLYLIHLLLWIYRWEAVPQCNLLTFSFVCFLKRRWGEKLCEANWEQRISPCTSYRRWPKWEPARDSAGGRAPVHLQRKWGKATAYSCAELCGVPRVSAMVFEPQRKPPNCASPSFTPDVLG